MAPSESCCSEHLSKLSPSHVISNNLFKFLEAP